jgi:pyruvate formate lyase activating enzyme
MSHEISGIVFDIQRAALHDGPGLRTTVFLKGCPLHCAWCHNPESQKLAPQQGSSGKVYGKEMTVAEVMQIVLADRDYYDGSSGGLTISGGEPTVQFAFCLALLRAAKAAGISTCLDTCGHLPTERLAELLPYVDLFHYDYKLAEPADHRAHTGVDNTLILKNLAFLRARGARIILRCPIIPGVNDTPAHTAAIAALNAAGPAFEAIERLPYHTIGHAKYTDLSRPTPPL